MQDNDDLIDEDGNEPDIIQDFFANGPTTSGNTGLDGNEVKGDVDAYITYQNDYGEKSTGDPSAIDLLVAEHTEEDFIDGKIVNNNDMTGIPDALIDEDKTSEEDKERDKEYPEELT